eukprot:CAMPEP_0185800734 /NCGR_PEP_ID=MMETSP1322-20130828/1042_1 /TAXON_ID=265543 /ORGANISM="Minutocellus polymorphus, Strain RCC2270" /LENGTH=234 /DNA_ID=CAMNT_0028496389 /DNA_START=269 /DNA_END=973 /DNA_ORIENTATION=+
MTKLTKKERQRMADTIEALQKAAMTNQEISEVIESNHEGETNWKNWPTRKRLKKVLEQLVNQGKAVEKGGTFRLPKLAEKKQFYLEEMRDVVRARQANGESLVIYGRAGAGDMSSSTTRNATHMAAVVSGGVMKSTRVLVRAQSQYSELTYSSPRMYNVDPKTLKRLANHSDISVAGLILKNRLLSVKGIDDATYQQIYLDWTNAKIDKAEARRLQSLPNDLKMYMLGQALRNL